MQEEDLKVRQLTNTKGPGLYMYICSTVRALSVDSTDNVYCIG